MGGVIMVRRKLAAVALLLAFAGLSGCQMPGGSGTWPNVECTATATDMLDEIEGLATAANPPQIDSIKELIVKCRKNVEPCKLTGSEHCAKVTAAVVFARMGKWDACEGELEHGH
jgi:hypothetical protein